MTRAPYAEMLSKHAQVMAMKDTGVTVSDAARSVGVGRDTARRWWAGGSPKRTSGAPKQTHCRRGHLYTPETEKLIQGKRTCRVCHNERQRRYHERNREYLNPRKRSGVHPPRLERETMADPEFAGLPVPPKMTHLWLYGPDVVKAFYASGLAVGKLQAMESTETSNQRGRLLWRLSELAKEGEWIRLDVFDRVFTSFWLYENDIESEVVHSECKPTNR